MVPSLQFPDQHQPRTRPALVAVVGTGSITIVEPESIFAAANRAGPVLVPQKTGINAKLRQNLLPSSAGTLDRVHGRRFGNSVTSRSIEAAIIKVLPPSLRASSRPAPKIRSTFRCCCDFEFGRVFRLCCSCLTIPVARSGLPPAGRGVFGDTLYAAFAAL
jgi:hypothetical protein